MRVPASTLFVVVLAVSGCEPSPDRQTALGVAPPVVAEVPETPVMDTIALAEARRVAAELEPGLMDRLVSAMARGGTAAALGYCVDSAQAIIERLMGEGARTVRRVSAQARNPVNAPDSLEAVLLERMTQALSEARLSRDTAFMTAETDGRRVLHYARPILVRQACLACHGDPVRFSPQLRDLLARKYPHDQAINYSIGGLRGIVSVRLEVP